MSPPIRRLLVLALVVYAVALAVVLLNPSPAGPSALVDLVATTGLRLDLPAALVDPTRVEFGLNVVAFLPLSLFGSLVFSRITVSSWTAAGFAGSLAVEVAQIFLPDRSATHSDIVANTLGAALGAVLGALLAVLGSRLAKRPTSDGG